MSFIPTVLLSAALICGACGQTTDKTEMYEMFRCTSLRDVLNKIEIKYECNPTATPTVEPTAVPTSEPTATPTVEPTAVPTTEPTATPTSEPTATPTSEPTTESDFAAEVVRLVNEERAKEGLSALEMSEDLTEAANKRAVETSSVFSHTRPDGSSCFTVLSEFGISYRSAGENIAYGQKTPEDVVNSWMNSSGHRANILSSNYTKIGVGVYKSGNTYYWTQLFTG